jgi:hypothetical protein
VASACRCTKPLRTLVSTRVTNSPPENRSLVFPIPTIPDGDRASHAILTPGSQQMSQFRRSVPPKRTGGGLRHVASSLIHLEAHIWRTSVG